MPLVQDTRKGLSSGWPVHGHVLALWENLAKAEAVSGNLYQTRVDRGECALCTEQYDRTVCFEDCDHATPVCLRHWDEYFNDTDWMPSVYLDPLCPDCFG